MTKERNHFYTYTVGVRTESTRPILNAKGHQIGSEPCTIWPSSMVTHCANMWEVAGRLGKHIDDIRFEHKEIER